MTDIRIGTFGPLTRLDIVMFVWFALVTVSVAYVAWDAWRNNPELKVMKLGWVLSTFFLGPLGLFLYVVACKEPAPGQHERFVNPLWRQALGSTIHMIGGDGTGIVVAAVITGLLGLPMILDFAIEYVAGFAFGLFVFQALFMKDMLGGSYMAAVRSSLMPEWLSMGFMMALMFPVMTIAMMGQDMRAMEPTQPIFWGAMSLAVLAALIGAYPVNYWMVAKGMKMGMGTMRALGEGGHSMDMEREMSGDAARASARSDRKGNATRTTPATDNGGKKQHGGMDMGTSGTAGGQGSASGEQQMAEGTPADRSASGESIEPALRVTRPQVHATSFLSAVALVAGLFWPSTITNLWLGARDVGGLIMPPGMIMQPDTPGEAMRDMAAVDHTAMTYRAPVDASGDQPLEPVMDGDVKVFRLETSIIEWSILDDQRVMAYAVNRQVPGPRIRVTQGDAVRIEVTNNLPESTSIHWHGLIVPNQFDGPAYITQEPIPPGGSFTYEFTVNQAGTFFYHSHDNADRQEALGLYGAFIIDPADPAAAPDVDQEVVIQLQEWLERDGFTFPAMPMDGAQPNFFTINGKAWPATQRVQARVGDRILFRFIGSQSGFIHPMHIHGGPFEIVATDGQPVPDGAVLEKDTVNIAPGERYDVIWTAREPGTWILHCHINHHTTNDNVEEEGAGGLTMAIEVAP